MYVYMCTPILPTSMYVYKCMYFSEFLGNVASSPGGVLPAGAAAVSLAAIQLPGPEVSADASKLSIGRPTLLSSHSYDSSVVADRAQAPVMLQAGMSACHSYHRPCLSHLFIFHEIVARSNPLVCGGRGSSGLGRGGRIPLVVASMAFILDDTYIDRLF